MCVYVLQIFKKYQKIVLGSDSHTKKEEKPEKVKEFGKKKDETTSVPKPVKEVEVETTNDSIPQQQALKPEENVEQASSSAFKEESLMTGKENDAQSSVDAGKHSNERWDRAILLAKNLLIHSSRIEFPCRII